MSKEKKKKEAKPEVPCSFVLLTNEIEGDEAGCTTYLLLVVRFGGVPGESKDDSWREDPCEIADAGGWRTLMRRMESPGEREAVIKQALKAKNRVASPEAIKRAVRCASFESPFPD